MQLTSDEKFEYLNKAIDVLLGRRQAGHAEASAESGGVKSQSAARSAKRKRSTSSERK